MSNDVVKILDGNTFVVSDRCGDDRAARLVQETGSERGRLQGPEVPHRRSRHRGLHRDGRGGERASRLRHRAGARPRPDRRGGVQ